MTGYSGRCAHFHCQAPRRRHRHPTVHHLLFHHSNLAITCSGPASTILCFPKSLSASDLASIKLESIKFDPVMVIDSQAMTAFGTCLGPVFYFIITLIALLVVSVWHQSLPGSGCRNRFRASSYHELLCLTHFRRRRRDRRNAPRRRPQNRGRTPRFFSGLFYGPSYSHPIMPEAISIFPVPTPPTASPAAAPTAAAGFLIAIISVTAPIPGWTARAAAGTPFA